MHQIPKQLSLLSGGSNQKVHGAGQCCFEGLFWLLGVSAFLNRAAFSHRPWMCSCQHSRARFPEFLGNECYPAAPLELKSFQSQWCVSSSNFILVFKWLQSHLCSKFSGMFGIVWGRGIPSLKLVSNLFAIITLIVCVCSHVGSFLKGWICQFASYCLFWTMWMLIRYQTTNFSQLICWGIGIGIY